MPKYRKLHVKATESLDINDMPDDFTRLMWLLLPLRLCRLGRGLDNPSWLKSMLFPLRMDVTFEMIETAMCWYAERGMIRRYEIGGRQYFCIPSETWHKYQGNTEREAESDYPPPPDESTNNSRPSQDLVVTKSRSDAYAHVDAQVDAYAPEQEQIAPSITSWEQQNPAIVSYKRITGRKVPSGIWADRIQETVGLDPPDLERWERVIQGWVGVGWKSGNVKGMLDYFNRNEIPGDRSNGRGPRKREEAEPAKISGWEPCIVPGEEQLTGLGNVQGGDRQEAGQVDVSDL